MDPLVDFQIFNFEVFNVPVKCHWRHLRDLIVSFIPNHAHAVLSVRIFKDKDNKWAVVTIRSYELTALVMSCLNGLAWYDSALAVSNMVPQFDYYMPMFYPVAYEPPLTAATSPMASGFASPVRFRGQSDPEIRHENTSQKRLFIGNIPFTSAEDRLERFINAKVANVRVEMQTQYGVSKGYAIAECETEDDATRAIEEFDGVEFEGRSLTVRHDKLPAYHRKYQRTSIPVTEQQVPRSEKDKDQLEREEARVARELVNALRSK